MEEEKLKKRILTKIIILVVASTVMIGLGIIFVLGNRVDVNFDEESKEQEDASYTETVGEGEVEPEQRIGMHGKFWDYDVITKEDDVEKINKILEDGKATLWPGFTEDGLNWLSGYNPETFGYFADNINVGSIIELVAPIGWGKKHALDNNTVLEYEIVETIKITPGSDSVFESTGLSADAMYNDGLDEPSIVIQYDGKGDEEILHFGQLVEKEEDNN